MQLTFDRNCVRLIEFRTDTESVTTGTRSFNVRGRTVAKIATDDFRLCIQNDHVKLYGNIVMPKTLNLEYVLGKFSQVLSTMELEGFNHFDACIDYKFQDCILHTVIYVGENTFIKEYAMQDYLK